jgi:DMSO reductase anchor subunit
MEGGEGFPKADIGPSIQIIPLREGGRAPESSLPAEAPRYTGATAPAIELGLRSEWPLALFTFLAATLFGMVAGSVRVGLRVHPVLFLTMAIVAMAVSAAHLGKKWRAWRSLLNVGQSWLSREVTFFTLFVVTASAYLVWAPGQRAIGWGALVVGAVALLSIDMVYKFAMKPSITHSSGALLTGAFLAGVVTANPFVAGVVGIVKIGLYARRKIGFAMADLDARPLVSVLRLGVGFIVPALSWTFVAGGAYEAVLASALLGEIMDRCEFYAELETMTPARQMADDLRRRMGGVGGQRGQVGQW